MIDKILSIIPFDAVRKWLSDHPDISFLLLLLLLVISVFGGFYYCVT